MKNLSKKTLGIFIGLSAFSILSFGDVAIKSVTSQMDTLATGLYMNLFTIAFLIPLILFLGIKKAFFSETVKFQILRSIFMLGTYLGMIITFNHLPLATSYTIGFLMPFILNILAFFLIKEKISIHRWGAILVGFLAILIAMRPGIEPFNIGYITCFGAVVCLACGSITVKYISPKDHWLTYISYPMVIQTTIIAIIMLFSNTSFALPEMESSLIIWLILGGLSFSIGLSLLPQGMKLLDASLFGNLFYVIFPWGILFGYIFFNDVIDVWTLLSAVIIVLSGFYLFYREKREGSKLIK